jgi:hypothetical protein
MNVTCGRRAEKSRVIRALAETILRKLSADAKTRAAPAALIQLAE